MILSIPIKSKGVKSENYEKISHKFSKIIKKEANDNFMGFFSTQTCTDIFTFIRSQLDT